MINNLSRNPAKATGKSRLESNFAQKQRPSMNVHDDHEQSLGLWQEAKHSTPVPSIDFDLLCTWHQEKLFVWQNHICVLATFFQLAPRLPSTSKHIQAPVSRSQQGSACSTFFCSPDSDSYRGFLLLNDWVPVFTIWGLCRCHLSASFSAVRECPPTGSQTRRKYHAFCTAFM